MDHKEERDEHGVYAPRILDEMAKTYVRDGWSTPRISPGKSLWLYSDPDSDVPTYKFPDDEEQ